MNSLNEGQNSNGGAPLSDGQERVLYLLLTASSLLSFVGSYFIVMIVWNSKKKKGALSLYDRLLAALSICDAIASILHWIFGCFFMPRGSRVWAFGNHTTCSVFGFIGFTVFSSLLYSSMISLYYMLVVRCGLRDDQLDLKFEIPMHILCVFWPMIGYGLFWYRDAFAPRRLGLNCYASNYPNGCVDAEKDVILEEGQVRCKLPGYYISAVPLIFSLLLIVVCNSILYYHVRASVKQSQKRATKRLKDISNFLGDSGRDLDSSKAREANEKASKGKLAWWKTRNTSEEIEGYKSQKLRAVMNQSLFYVAAIAATFVPVCVQSNVAIQPQFSYENESKIFLLLCFTTFMPPLQGILNLLIFCRPTYLRIRKVFPHQSRLRCFQRTIEAGTSSRKKKNNVYSPSYRQHENTTSIKIVWKKWKKRIDNFFNYDSSKATRSNQRNENSINSLERPSEMTNSSKGSIQKSHNIVSSCQSPQSTKGPKLTAERLAKIKSLDQPSSHQMSPSKDMESFHLEMMECSSSSSSSASEPYNEMKLQNGNDKDSQKNGDGSNNAVEVNEGFASITVDQVPEMANIQSRHEDGNIHDWDNIEFESSCVPYFSSTASTIEA